MYNNKFLFKKNHYSNKKSYFYLEKNLIKEGWFLAIYIYFFLTWIKIIWIFTNIYFDCVRFLFKNHVTYIIKKCFWNKKGNWIKKYLSIIYIILIINRIYFDYPICNKNRFWKLLPGSMQVHATSVFLYILPF